MSVYKFTVIIMSFFLLNPGYAETQPSLARFDICVYGGTSAGVIAAYTAAKMGKKVVLIEPGYRLGGLSAGGLGFTDIGNKYVVTGLARDFYRRIGRHYGKFEQWTFEPKIALSVFEDYVKRGGFKVIYGRRLNKTNKNNTRIVSIDLESSLSATVKHLTISAKQFIDCSYEGDLMAKAGVSYTIGREANSVYHETVNGVQLKSQNQLPDGVDPYKTPGDPESGLLWGISSEKLAPAGSGDKKIQAYNFRICLTNDPANRIAIDRPLSYDSIRYELLLRILAVKPTRSIGTILKLDLMPNHKTDINNNGGFSTDMVGMNYDYPNGDYKLRREIVKQHDNYTRGLLYFIGHDPRMPEELRKQMLEWGYPKDEYLTTNHRTIQLYVREARRMLGSYVMTQANCEGKAVVTDAVGMGAYNMDSHNAERLVVNGMVKNEGDVQLRGISPYPIAYGSMIPQVNECNNLLVPVCLSASHMAYGSIRMEPVFMVLGQSAAAAACQAIDHHTAIHEIDIKKLQADLINNPLADGSTPEILVDNDDTERTVVSKGWLRKPSGGYGPSYFLDTTGDARIKFNPVVKKAGHYAVYYYYPKVQHAASTINVNIFDGRRSISKKITRDGIRVVGQTSGEWVWLDTLRLPVGNRAYLEVVTKGADGAVAADAVLLVPIIK